MKRTKFFFLSSVILLASHSLIAQTLQSPARQYNDDRPWNILSETNEQGQDSVQRLFNYKTLNMLFANKVGTAFGSTNDLSLQKFFAALDAGDNSLAIGVNFDSRAGDKFKKLSWVFSAGVKFKAKDKFAVIYNDGDFQEDNIGANLKVSFIGNGIINYNGFAGTRGGATRMKTIENYHKYLDTKYNSKVSTFNEENLDSFKTEIENISIYSPNASNLQSALNKKKDELYVEMVKEEVSFLENSKMYNYLWDYWFSLEAFVPFGQNTYQVTPNANTSLDKKSFYAISGTLSATTMWQWTNGTSLFVNGSAIFKNNNNILVDNISSKSFQTTTQGSDDIIIITDNTSGYITDFEQFVTTTLVFEPAFFILNNSIGFSPAIELNFGEYNESNWKLGIPVSLKDKDGKPKVNFELQWKEVRTLSSSVHLVGISANFQFGELIN